MDCWDDTGPVGSVEAMGNGRAVIRGTLPGTCGISDAIRARRRGQRRTSDAAASIAGAVTSSYAATESILVTVIVATCVLVATLAQDWISLAAIRRHEWRGSDDLSRRGSANRLSDRRIMRRFDDVRSVGGREAVEPERESEPEWGPEGASEPGRESESEPGRGAERESASEPGRVVFDPDPRAVFETFWNDHYRYYLALLMKMGATLDDAEDTVGDVMVKMLDDNTLARLTNPEAWVRTAVLHRYYDRRKRERQRLIRELGAHAGETSRDGGLNIWEDWQWVQQLLSALPPTQRSVFELVIAELGTTEIADLLGKTPATVRQNLAHARKRLRTHLGQRRLIDPVGRPAATRREEVD